MNALITKWNNFNSQKKVCRLIYLQSQYRFLNFLFSFRLFNLRFIISRARFGSLLFFCCILMRSGFVLYIYEFLTSDLSLAVRSLAGPAVKGGGGGPRVSVDPRFTSDGWVTMNRCITAKWFMVCSATSSSFLNLNSTFCNRVRTLLSLMTLLKLMLSMLSKIVLICLIFLPVLIVSDS